MNNEQDKNKPGQAGMPNREQQNQGDKKPGQTDREQQGQSGKIVAPTPHEQQNQQGGKTGQQGSGIDQKGDRAPGSSPDLSVTQK